MFRSILVAVFVLMIAQCAWSQQIAVLKHGRVNARFNLGDEIRFQLKDQEKVTYHAAIIAIHEFDFVTVQKDTIAFSRVSKLKFKNPGRKKYGVSTMVAGASLYLLSLGLDEAFGDKNQQSIKGLKYVGIYGGAFGAFVYLTANSSMKINGIRRLKYIGYDSPLYK